MTVVGARPQFIKAAPLSIELAKSPFLEEKMVHTGQHYDENLSDIFFKELNLPVPKYNLSVGSERPVVQVAQILLKLDAVIEKEKPDMIVVFGDTNSTAAGAIAAAKNHIPLAHVEAGLREGHKSIPEEINKLLTDSVTDLYFCPTKTGVLNLKKAGISQNIYLTGDIGLDLLVQNKNRYMERAVLNKYGVTTQNYYFFTCHRAANTDNANRLKNILESLQDLDKPVIFPIHPRTKARIEAYGLSYLLENKHIKMLDPLGFWDTQSLIHHANMVLTDSGGVVKEAYFHKVRCVILDTQIEWIEAVKEGWARLVGADTQNILHTIQSFDTPSVSSHFLGKGKAAAKIVKAIKAYLNRADVVGKSDR